MVAKRNSSITQNKGVLLQPPTIWFVWNTSCCCLGRVCISGLMSCRHNQQEAPLKSTFVSWETAARLYKEWLQAVHTGHIILKSASSSLAFFSLHQHHLCWSTRVVPQASKSPFNYACFLWMCSPMIYYIVTWCRIICWTSQQQNALLQNLRCNTHLLMKLRHETCPNLWTLLFSLQSSSRLQH